MEERTLFSFTPTRLSKYPFDKYKRECVTRGIDVEKFNKHVLDTYSNIPLLYTSQDVNDSITCCINSLRGYNTEIPQQQLKYERRANGEGGEGHMSTNVLMPLLD